MKIGIMGGTFDPIHYGHLVLAQEAYEQLDLDLVEFVPTWRPQYKMSQASYETRFGMCLNALAHDARFGLCGYERSFMVDTLACLRTDFPEAGFYLILGGDQASRFFTWRDPLGILAQVERVAYSERSIYDQGRILDHWGEHKGKLDLLEMEAMGISSSLVRQKAAAGLSLRYLVPPAVEEFILSEGLYG